MKVRLIIFFTSLASIAAAETMYTVASLGSLPGMSSIEATAINNNGQVTGTMFVDDEPNAFLYSAGALTDINPSGARTSFGSGINDAGDVVGRMYSASFSERGFLYSGGAVTDLGLLPGAAPNGYGSAAVGINNAGQIVGSSNTGTTFIQQGFLDQNGQMSPLPGMAQVVGLVPAAINNAGVVAGDSPLAAVSNTIGSMFIDDNGVVSYVPCQHVFCFPNSINSSGQVAGYGDDGTTLNDYAFVYMNGALQQIGALPGESSSRAYGINDAGQVVGSSSNPEPYINGSAFIYQNGVMTNLNSLIQDSDPGLWLVSANGINNSGQIIAEGLDDEAYLLTPEPVTATPEPSTFALFGCGLLSAFALRRTGSRSSS